MELNGFCPTSVPRIKAPLHVAILTFYVRLASRVSTLPLYKAMAPLHVATLTVKESYLNMIASRVSTLLLYQE